MKNIFHRIWSATAVLAAGAMIMTSCSQEDVADLNPGVRPQASDIDAVINVDQETNEVTFTLNNKGVTPVWKIYTSDKPKISTVNGYHDIITTAGTYQVEVQMSNRNGVCEGSKLYEFTINNTIVDFAPYIRRLTDNSSKTWMFAKDEQGHLGCGESGSDGLGWWSAAPDDKAGTGLYENRFTFTDKGEKSTGAYTYDPGTSGTVYVNTGITDLPPYSDSNTYDGIDYSAPAQLQETTFEIKPEGTDLYLIFPAGTLLGYLPNVEAYNEPKFKINSISNDKVELTIDNGAIAWHYILTTEGEPPFQGFKYDSGFNMWKSATLSEPELWYAPGWIQIANPEYTYDGTTYTIVLPEATSETWQAQMKILTDMSTTSASNYDYSVIINSNQSFNGVTIKLTDAADDGNFYFEQKVEVKAYEDYVFYLSDMPGRDISALRMVFDFGGCPAGTTVTLRNIVLKDHANDDGTVLPAEPEPEPEQPVSWVDVNSTDNFWSSCTYTTEFFTAAGSDWHAVADPSFTEEGKGFSVVYNEAPGSDQWQAQVKLHTSLTTAADKNYDFRLSINASNDIANATIKLVHTGGGDYDNIFYFADRKNLSMDENHTISWINMPGIDMSAVSLIFDFAGAPAGTKITVSDIILQEHRE